MATVNKSFHFALSAEGWIGNPSTSKGAHIDMAWYPPHKKRMSAKNYMSHQDNPLLSTMGGSLRTSARRGSTQTDNSWEWAGSFEDLGVPSGGLVTAIASSYLWRIDLKDKHPDRHSVLEWSFGKFSQPVGSGPFELCDSGGTLIDTFSSRDYPPDRPELFAIDPYFLAWPRGYDSDAVKLKPNSWKEVTGSISGLSHSSSTSIILKLWSRMPACPDDFNQWLRMKNDYVSLDITYNPPVVVGSTKFFFS